jgi:ActR/RegA family two-component response regulator
MALDILVVDDDPISRKIVYNAIGKLGHEVQMAEGYSQALVLFKTNDFDIIITDKNMPGPDDSSIGGMDLLRYVKQKIDSTAVIIMTAYASIDTVIEAMKLGAFDYLTKPLQIEDLKTKLERIQSYKRLLNPAESIRIYRTLHDEILDLLKIKHELSDEDFYKRINMVDRKLDRFFQVQSEWERIMLVQKEALSNIGQYAEMMREELDEATPGFDLLEKICDEAAKRL